MKKVYIVGIGVEGRHKLLGEYAGSGSYIRYQAVRSQRCFASDKVQHALRIPWPALHIYFSFSAENVLVHFCPFRCACFFRYFLTT